MQDNVSKDRALLWIHYNGTETPPESISLSRWRGMVKQLARELGYEKEKENNNKDMDA